LRGKSAFEKMLGCSVGPNLVNMSKVKMRSAKLMRKLSLMIYIFHLEWVFCLRFIGYVFSIRFTPLWIFVLALMLSVASGLVILKLAKVKKLRFLKYAS
jgi:hypothetical protein